MNGAIWNKASPRRKRILSIAAVLAVALAITTVGSFTPMDPNEANQISENLNQTVALLEGQGALTQYIFGNNFLICLLMFIPVIGPLVGLFVLFSTGSAIGAIATVGGYPPFLALFALLITPVAWLEFTAYSTAMAESVWLIRRLFQRKGVEELKRMCIFVSICAVLLVAGALVEVFLVSLV